MDGAGGMQGNYLLHEKIRGYIGRVMVSVQCLRSSFLIWAGRGEEGQGIIKADCLC